MDGDHKLLYWMPAADPAAAGWSGGEKSLGEGRTDGKNLPIRTCMCGSALDCGCVVNGSGAVAAS